MVYCCPLFCPAATSEFFTRLVTGRLKWQDGTSTGQRKCKGGHYIAVVRRLKLQDWTLYRTGLAGVDIAGLRTGVIWLVIDFVDR